MRRRRWRYCGGVWLPPVVGALSSAVAWISQHSSWSTTRSKKKMVLGGPRQISATAKKLHIRKEKQRNVRGMVKLASNFPTTPVENMCTILFVIRVIEMCSPPDTRRVKQNAFTVLHMKQSRPNRGGNWSRLRVRIGWASAHVLLT